jgi:hypothetical protein
MYVQITNVETRALLADLAAAGSAGSCAGRKQCVSEIRNQIAVSGINPASTKSVRVPMAVRAATPVRFKARGNYLSNPVPPELAKSRNNNAKETAIAARL